MTKGQKRETLATIIKMVDDNDQWYREAHARSRKDIDALTAKVDSNYNYFRERVEWDKEHIVKLSEQMSALDDKPVNVDKVLFTPRIVMSALGVIGTIWILFWSTTGSIRGDTAALHSDVRDILTRMDAQKTASEARANAQDVQSNTLRNDVADLKRQLQLQQFDIQNLKDLVTQKKAGK